MAEEPEGRAQRTDQVNIRLSPEELDVAQSLAFLDDVSVGRLLQGVIVDFLAAHGDSQEVLEVRIARQRHRSRKSGDLTNLADRKRKSEE